MAKRLKPATQFLIFIAIFFILNILQSTYTGLLEDEAYYWMWSKDLDFGYFDHPPMVALWIKISHFFFDGELGVRFLSTLSFSFMLYLLWKLIDVKDKNRYIWLYFLLIVSVAMLNIYGFVSTPDTPLLFFTVIFLYYYKYFLKEENWYTVLGLGFGMAGMIYSKYHGVFVILFVVLSNLKLLKNKKFWLAGLFGFALFIPHIYWQYIHDFPSIRYHLFERSNSYYKFENTIMFLVDQIAFVGLTFPLMYYAFFKEKITNQFEKALKYIVFGFLIVFFISSFKQRTQAQWTIINLIPLVIISFRYFVKHQKARKWLIILGSANLVIMLIARVFLANETLSPIEFETHFAKHWIPRIKAKTQGKPLVFVNSYRNAAVYNFYTGIQTYSYSALWGRKSQYDLKDYEKNMQHKDIYTVSKEHTGDSLVVKDKRTLYGKEIKDYTTFQKVTCKLPDKEIILNPGKEKKLDFIFTNPYDHPVDFQNTEFIGVFQWKKNRILSSFPLKIEKLKPVKGKESSTFTAVFTVPGDLIRSEAIQFRIALRFYNLPEGFQGNRVNVKIQN